MDLLHLPEDVYIEIIKYLNKRDLRKLASTCHSLKIRIRNITNLTKSCDHCHKLVQYGCLRMVRVYCNKECRRLELESMQDLLNIEII